MAKNGHFLEVFLDFFRNHTLLGAKFFCVAFSASRRLFSKTVFGQFLKIFIIKGFGGVQKLPNEEEKGQKKILKKNSLLEGKTEQESGL